MNDPPSTFLPNIYKKVQEQTPMKTPSIVSTFEQQKLPGNITTYINSYIEKLIKPQFETFENEDIKLNMLNMINDLQVAIDNAVKKSGDVVSGTLHILKSPQANLDVVNKEYADWLFSTLNDKIESKITKTADIDMNYFKIKNVQGPIDLHDVANKNYVDQKFDNIYKGCDQPLQHIFSKGCTLTINRNQNNSVKKTFFFNPGFICPQKIHIVSVGFSTSPYKYKIGEKLKVGSMNPTKLYFMINNEIRSEYVIEKDIQLGHMLKEFDNPIVFEKGDNFMMVIETMIEDTSVNVAFY